MNGIDFVEVVNPEQTRLRVHFMNASPDRAALVARLKAVSITGGETIPEVAVLPAMSWGTDAAGRPILELAVAAPGDFSTYTLRLDTEPRLLDPFFDHVEFSFKAGCPSTLDCRAPEPECPPLAESAPRIDYLAKDFQSFRTALFEFSALRYPAWKERSEADFGVMFMEALASLADDLSYQQDRIAAEAWIETATERRSLVRLARLVDCEPRVATAARVMLEFEMAAGASGPIPAGLMASALAPDGALIEFETGTGLDDEHTYQVRPEWNALQPHWWDDWQRCLLSEAVEMWIEDPGFPLPPGQLLLIDTAAESAADPPVREIVKLVPADSAPTTDPLYGVPVVKVAWRAEDALKFEHDLTRTRVGGNLVPATQGRRCTERFVTSPTGWTHSGGVPRAIVRTGANGTVQFLHTLHEAPLAWLAPDDPRERPRPEIRVTETSNGGKVWRWFRSLLEPTPIKEIVTLDPVRYRVIDAAEGMVDYDGDDGETIRFGDGVFGAIPVADAVFEVTYRSGGGARSNVAADAVNRVDATHPLALQVVSVRNPLPASGGRDPESADQVRERAPQEFRAQQYRAVRSEDYEKAAMTLPWVQRAGTTFRCTGSWLTVFTSVDPVGSESLPPSRTAELTDLLNRYRLAGYESFALDPRYASLDLAVTVCARPDAFRGDVKRGILSALDALKHVDGSSGFFHPDRFTFGVALERSAVEAAVQEVPGVDGVIEVRYRRRGYTPEFIAMPDFVPVAKDEIVRVDNDPSRPERGSLRIDVIGGK
ncbi:MAG: baseplate J/gp47 family protein [Rhodospirillales bacterium]|nr:baseplate J/gp47 family protein [Rhodospirillales bacterium]